MGLSTAERNRRKRERKKKEREEQRQLQVQLKEEAPSVKQEEDVEIEYVAPDIPFLEDSSSNDDPAMQAVRRFQEREAAILVSEDEAVTEMDAAAYGVHGSDNVDDDPEHESSISKRKIRDLLRPSVAELKRRVQRPDLVETHDVTAADPEFLIQLKGVAGSVGVPRHWGRKRKYLQGKRGFEKPPFQLPDFIENTGITELRGAVAEDEESQSAKQKNRSRVAPKMGAIDVDYKTLHDAFFKHQTKPKNLTQFGDVYYEGKEMEVKTNIKPGGPLSNGLREGLGMTTETAPPPWLINMQRYGPPPSFPSLKIPGLNAPLPNSECQYGYHPGGWGKPPLDPYGRPLYGGTPFDPPGSTSNMGLDGGGLVTSDGKTVANKSKWGALPTGYLEADEESDKETSEEEMEESSDEEGEEETAAGDGIESVLPPPPGVLSSTAPLDLRKQAGDETPAAPKQLYQVIEQKKVGGAATDQGTVFASEVAYVVPGGDDTAASKAASVPEGAESVLSKALPEAGKRKRKADEDDEDDLGKNFKF
jgi:splicing factor 3B subunit 2